jgi:hypothetical protein
VNQSHAGTADYLKVSVYPSEEDAKQAQADLIHQKIASEVTAQKVMVGGVMYSHTLTIKTKLSGATLAAASSIISASAGRGGVNQSHGGTASALARGAMQWSDGMKEALVVIVNEVRAGTLSATNMLPRYTHHSFWAGVARKMAKWMSDGTSSNHYSSNEFSHATMYQYYHSMQPAKVQPELTRNGVTVMVSSNDHLLLVVQEKFTELSFKEDEKWVVLPKRDRKEKWSQVVNAWLADGGTVKPKLKAIYHGLYGRFVSMRIAHNKKWIETAGPEPPRRSESPTGELGQRKRQRNT